MRIITFALFLFWSISSTAQFQQQQIFQSLQEEALLEQLVATYKPNDVLSSSNARDTLFKVVYGQTDTVECIYTGLKRYLIPGQDPTQSVFNNDNENGLNTEHTYPKSLGANGGFAESDMHHLYPTRGATNADRNNFPFADINDSQTERWYIRNLEQNSIPSQNIDAYSEWRPGFFEPRESVKGNIARAMFYFYTMYKTQADNADPNFFNAQRETLLRWHRQDPVDSMEWVRTFIIANYQDGKPNPFVLDPSLAERAYCVNQSNNCGALTATNELIAKHVRLEQNSPNPFDGVTSIRYTLHNPFQVRLSIYNILGEEIAVLVNESQVTGEYVYNWDKTATALPSGVAFYRLTLHNEDHNFVLSKKMLVLK